MKIRIGTKNEKEVGTKMRTFVGPHKTWGLRLLGLFLNWRLGEKSQLGLGLAPGESDSQSPIKVMLKVRVNTQA